MVDDSVSTLMKTKHVAHFDVTTQQPKLIQAHQPIWLLVKWNNDPVDGGSGRRLRQIDSEINSKFQRLEIALDLGRGFLKKRTVWTFEVLNFIFCVFPVRIIFCTSTRSTGVATPPSLSTRSSIAAESETGEQLHVTGTYHSKSVSFKLSWQSTKPEGLQHHTLANHFIAGNTSSVSWPTVWPDSLLEFGPLWALFDPSSWLNQR